MPARATGPAIMRRLFAVSIITLLGCASPAPLPPKKTEDRKVADQLAIKRIPLAPGQAHAEILKTERLARADQMPVWKLWAGDKEDPLLQSRGLMELVWANDPAYVHSATAALDSSYSRARTVAARVLTLAEPTNPLRSALFEALAAATEEERTTIVWALVKLGEKTIAPVALDELRRGSLVKVTRLDGGNAFDAEALARLFTPGELTSMAKDESAAVRALVAVGLGHLGDAKSADLLIVMVQDADAAVAAKAAGGLARSADKRGREAVLKALRNADREHRQRLLEGLRDIAGGPGLVLALDSVQDKPDETAWFQTKQIFDMLKVLADPRASDGLVAWASGSKRHGHWLGEVGTRLAEVGDLRAAKFLGDRLRLEPTKLYSAERFWEADEGGHLSRTDLPRVVAARMLADLAMIHADKRAELLLAAEGATMYWLNSRPQPHANGLRFLATAGSTKVIPDIRGWAFPKEPLPKKGDSPPFPSEFETAQMALRYIGLLKDEPSFPKLLGQLQRKQDKTLDITQEGLMEGGMAMMGMALRAIGYGASQGLAHWGDVRAAGPLMTFIEDETWHEEARQSACDALSWCADAKTMAEVARKAHEFGANKDPKKQLIGTCYAQTLSLAPVPEVVPVLVEMLGPGLNEGLRMAYGRAIGITGFDSASEEKLFRKLEDPASRDAAALALILGGSADTAARALATMAEFGPAVLGNLKDQYYRAFGYWSDVDFTRGNIYRWVANAEAMSRVEVGGVLQEWARKRLQAQFGNLMFDNGPHSETRVVLRSRLYREAKSGAGVRKKGAIMTLVLMREQGVLMALREEPGETGAMAQKALHDVKNPAPGMAEL